MNSVPLKRNMHFVLGSMEAMLLRDILLSLCRIENPFGSRKP